MALGALDRLLTSPDTNRKLILQQRPCKSTTDQNLGSMTSNLLSIIQILPLIAILALILRHSHLLITLLSLEAIILTIVLFVPLSLTLSGIPLVIMRVVLLTFGACEARLGLRLIVIIARSYGSDLINSLSINKC